jgi:hypothetical protein
MLGVPQGANKRITASMADQDDEDVRRHDLMYGDTRKYPEENEREITEMMQNEGLGSVNARPKRKRGTSERELTFNGTEDRGGAEG